MQTQHHSKTERIAAIGMIIVFALCLLGGLAAYIWTPDKTVSESERRTLTKWPEFSLKTWQDGSWAKRLETYGQDQNPLREQLRGIKAQVQYNLLLRGDNNGYYQYGGHMAKLEYPLKPGEIQRAANKFNELADKYFDGCSLYYSIVPDKNCFLAAQSGRPAMDYGQIGEILEEELYEKFENIPLGDSIGIEDYYKTDTHWMQQNLLPAAKVLAKGMGAADRIDWDGFREETVGQFYGVLYGQTALPAAQEDIVCLYNEAIENAAVYDLNGEKLGGVYAVEKLTDGTSLDGYDVYLYGATPFAEIRNPAGKGQLIILRDSFGSSMAPIFTEAYGRVTVLDMRYITTDLLGEYLEVEPGADVLYLYSGLTLNSASMLK